MNKEDIEAINAKCPGGQGIFMQPSMIPADVKGHVIYTRYPTGGFSGGRYHPGAHAESFSSEPPPDRYRVLELVLELLAPKITFLQYKKIEGMIRTNEDTERHYYGNSTDWKVEYIILSELEEYLETL